jgi:hypothetical protein
MAIDFYRIIRLGLLLAASIAPNQSGAQVPASKGGTFPEKLLEGTAHFDLALSLQADLRGNYGPCG